MTSGLTIFVFWRKFIRLIKWLKWLSFYFIWFCIFIDLFYIRFLLPFWIHLQLVMLIEVLIIHQLGRVGFWMEMTSVHLLGLSDYDLHYNSNRVFGVSWKYSWLTPLLVIMWDCFLRNDAGEGGAPKSSDFFIKYKYGLILV